MDGMGLSWLQKADPHCRSNRSRRRKEILKAHPVPWFSPEKGVTFCGRKTKMAMENKQFEDVFPIEEDVFPIIMAIRWQ